MGIFEKYKSQPYFKLKVQLSNNYTLIVKWNVFKDKKDDFKPVMRARYILSDENGNRISLKNLNLKAPVEFKHIYISKEMQELIEVINAYNQKELFIFAHFGEWINKDFKKMIESGDYKITSMETLK
jgi:hypothetical protein